MRCTLASLALVALAAANPVPQGVTSAITPPGSAPAGCSPDYSGEFQIQVVKAAAKRSLSQRQSGALIMTLSGGVLMDNDGRTGYIAANRQFQFDDPPQTGAIYTAGWSVCSNGSLAIGPDALFYQCLSGDFYNLYDESTGDQCSPVYIDVIGGGAAAPAPSGGASIMSDGQPTAGPAVTQISDGQIQAPVCTQIVDGQPQCPTAVVTQISDGQIQAPTAAVTQISDGQIQAPTAAVTQISDGQIQAPTAVPAPVTQISDGQIQAPTGVVTQISDGQIQAPTAVVTQISDGQIQAPTGVVTQISDGQIQAPTAVVTQISDGQIQAPTSASNYTAPSVVPATGAAPSNNLGNGIFALFAGVVAVAFL